MRAALLPVGMDGVHGRGRLTGNYFFDSNNQGRPVTWEFIGSSFLNWDYVLTVDDDD